MEISGSAVHLGSTAVTAITNAGGAMVTTLLDNFIKLLPVIVLIVVGFMVLGMIIDVFKKKHRGQYEHSKTHGWYDTPDDWYGGQTPRQVQFDYDNAARKNGYKNQKDADAHGADWSKFI